MRIHEIDVHDEPAFRDFFVAMRDALLHGRPGAPMWSLHEAAVMFRRQEPAETWHALGAYDGNRLLGGALLVWPLLDNTDKAYAEVQVAPNNRRRGVGSALAEHVVDRVRDSGRTVLLGECNLPLDERDTHPYAQFARHHGFAPANVEVRRDLPLQVEADRLRAWEEEAAPHHQGYRIETYVDALPEQLLETYCALTNQLTVDAPTGDIEFEAEGLTPEAYRVREQKVEEQGRTMFETLAFDETGRVVAQSTLAVPADPPATVLQWGTIVHKDHRGHRLGLAVKVRNLAAMQLAFPERRKITTTNSEVNEHMVAINAKLGFEPVELCVEFQRTL